MERGGRDGEDTADTKGGRLGLALEGFSQGKEKVVGVDAVCGQSASDRFATKSGAEGQTVDACHWVF